MSNEKKQYLTDEVKKNKETKQYLADGVYAQYTSGQIRLTSENGIIVINEIFMDNTVMDAFSRYLKRNFKMEIVPVKKED